MRMHLALTVSLAVIALSSCGKDPAGKDTAALPSTGAGGTATGNTAAGTGTGTGATTGVDTWDNFAEAWFDAYCVSCHTGDANKDFADYASVAYWEEPIRCGVSPVVESGCGAWPPPAQFPVGAGPAPSDAERERLVAWIDAGLPQ